MEWAMMLTGWSGGSSALMAAARASARTAMEAEAGTVGVMIWREGERVRRAPVMPCQ